MGANFVTLKLTGTQTEVRAGFEAAQEQSRYEDGHSYSGGIGMARGLKLIGEDEPFADEMTAEEWLLTHCEKWEEALAVRLPDKDMWLIGAMCAS